MKYDINHINNAIVSTLGSLLAGEAKYSAKNLQATLGAFFFLAAGGGSNYGPEGDQVPEGYCYPYYSKSAEIIRMCEAIHSACKGFQGRNQLALIHKICEESKGLMTGFMVARDNGDYMRNVSYICELDEETDWGKQMLALKITFLPVEPVDA